jgi:DNA-binding protein HU-beta
MANHMNKDALIAAISEKTELSKKDIELVIDTMEEVVTKALKNDEKVTLTGFGTFRVSKRAERTGINPQTKEKIQIPAMNIPKFTAGKALKEAIK